MKKLIVALAFALSGHSAFAACVGSEGFQTCSDANGNRYNVQRIGDSTYMTGSNPNGSTWRQNSNTIGNTTYHNGTSANGQSWNGTSTTIGGTTYNRGTDSKGNPYSSTCNQYGCN